MNYVRMSTRKEAPGAAPAGPPAVRAARKQGDAFDLWLQRGLHQMFDEVANEPVPEEILRLIEEDRDRTSAGVPDSEPGTDA